MSYNRRNAVYCVQAAKAVLRLHLAGILLEGDVSDIIALDQPTSLISPLKATRMSP